MSQDAEDAQKSEVNEGISAKRHNAQMPSLMSGEELTALSPAEMAKVSKELEKFARLHPERVAGKDGTGSGSK